MRTSTWFLVLAACGGGAAEKDDTDATGSGGTTDTTSTDTDTDTSDTTHTDDTTGQGTSAAGPCADYSGVGLPVGTTWTFEVRPDVTGYTGTWTTTVTENDGTSSTVETDGTYEYPSYGTQTTYGRYTFACDATGALSVTGHYESANEAGETTYTLDVTYSPPALAFPVGLAVGSEWDTRWAGTQDDGTGPENFDYMVHYEVLGESELTLPAGTFTVVEIEQTSSLAPDAVTSQFFERRIGFVSAFFGELTEYDEP